MATNPSHFDIEAARSIRSGESRLLREVRPKEPWLDLGSFDTYDQDALDFVLADLDDIAGIEIGFRSLSTGAAHALAKLSVEFCYLSNLERLDESVASILANWKQGSLSVLDVVVQEPISVTTARTLVGALGKVTIALSLPSMDAVLAKALSAHQGALKVRLRGEQLSTGAATHLSRHRGWGLTIDLDMGVTEESRLALASNPMKSLSLPVKTGGWTVASLTDLALRG